MSANPITVKRFPSLSIIKQLFAVLLIAFNVSAFADQWVALGSGVSGGNVNAIAIDKNSGAVYVGGSFTSAGGVANTRYIAMWDGSSWHALGTGSYGVVNALVVDNSGNLYSGGTFGLMEWNGNAWSTLTLPSLSGYQIISRQVTAFALDVTTNALYVADSWYGQFGPEYLHGEDTFKWDGSSWIFDPNTSYGSSCTCLFIFNVLLYTNSTLYAGGIPNVAISGLNNSALALASDNLGNVYAGGSFTAASSLSPLSHVGKLSGTTWSALGSGMNGNVYALAMNPSGGLYAAGSFSLAGGSGANNISYWNGVNWNAMATGLDGQANAMVVDALGRLYVGGMFDTAGGLSTAGIAEWLPTIVRNDFNGGGKSDVLFINTTTGGTKYWQSAAKSQSVYVGAYSTANYSYAGSGDFNGDGKADLLFVKSSNNATLIWSGAVKTSATYPGTGAAGFGVAGICDTNGDGKDDIVWYNATTGKTQIWPSATKTGILYPGTGAAGFSIVACGDFDGDGKADLFWRNATTGADQIWNGASKGNMTYPGANTDLTAIVVGAGDIDGDGKSDLVWYKPSNGAINVWKGGLKSAASYLGANATTFTPKAIGDYDGDGKADLLWSNDTTLATQVWPALIKANALNPGTYPAGFSIQK